MTSAKTSPPRAPRPAPRAVAPWLGATLGLAIAGCDRDPAEAPAPTGGEPAIAPGLEAAAAVKKLQSAAPSEPPQAVSNIDAAEGVGVPLDGQARFWSIPGGVRVVVELNHAPVGRRGLHVHASGDCDTLAAGLGPHFNPGGNTHALPSEAAATHRHLGDLGNVPIGVDGRGYLSLELPGASLAPDGNGSLVGKPLVLSASEDHGQSNQPAGGSGTKVACGMIRTADGSGSDDAPG